VATVGRRMAAAVRGFVGRGGAAAGPGTPPGGPSTPGQAGG
jgi:hypothetical protein